MYVNIWPLVKPLKPLSAIQSFYNIRYNQQLYSMKANLFVWLSNLYRFWIYYVIIVIYLRITIVEN